MIDDFADLQRVGYRMRDIDLSAVFRKHVYDHDSLSDKQYLYSTGTDRCDQHRLLIQSTRC